MKEYVNPFYTGTNIPDEYFCDREQETARIIAMIENGTNVILKSPRRIGKSSLVNHIFRHKEIVRKYNTLYVDIFGTRNMAEFNREFQNVFMSSTFAKTRVGLERIKEILKNPYLSLELYPNGMPKSLQLGGDGTNPLFIPVREIFNFLEGTQRPNIIVFDEFQVIQSYPEKAAAIIRSFVQQSSNTHFIFSGSSRRLLTQMFENSNEPFYRSAEPIDLKPISFDAYSAFAEKNFDAFGKSIEKDACDLVYYLFSANTYDMQSVMHTAFMLAPNGGVCTRNTVEDSINSILDARDGEFREAMNSVSNERDRRTLFCIASEGLASKLTSSSMMKKYGLENASSVQNSLRSLSSDSVNLIRKAGRFTYTLSNRFLELWIARFTGNLDRKFSLASERYQKETELDSEMPGFLSKKSK